MKILILILSITLILSQSLAQPKGGKGNKKNSFDLSQLMDNFSNINDSLLEHPEKLEKISLQLEIKTDEQILKGIILTHLADYIHASRGGKRFLQYKERKERIEEKLGVKGSKTPEEAKKYLDKMLSALFDGYNIQNYEQIVQSDYMKEKNHNKVIEITQIPELKGKKLEHFASDIVKFFKSKVNPQTDKEYETALKNSIESIILYYSSERGAKEEELRGMLARTQRFSDAGYWAKQFFANPEFASKFQDLVANEDNIEQSLQSLIDDPEKMEALFGGEQDEKEWQDISRQVHDLAQDNNIDLGNVDEFIDEYQERQKQKSREAKIRDMEEESKKHDATVLTVLGVIVFVIIMVFVCRYIRKQKLARDAYNRSSYSQGI